MYCFKINLKDIYPNILEKDVHLNGLIYDENFEYPNNYRDAVLILPGGGYEFISYREKDPVMFKFLSLGYNAFSLDYSCKTIYPTPYLELMCAIHYLNSHHEELRIKKQHISLIGFSAGGHLACSYAGIYKQFSKYFPVKLIRPYALVLSYPVTSLAKTKCMCCVKNIANYSNKIKHLLSADETMHKDYPPTFMWTTKTDQTVNPNNVLWLKKALNKYKIKNQCIMYKNGPHGLSLANEATSNNRSDYLNKKVSEWPDKAHEFIQSIKE